MALALALGLLACQKDEAATSVAETAIATTDTSPNNGASGEVTNGSMVSNCECQYQVISFSATLQDPLNEHPEYFLTGTSSFCEPQCFLFNGTYGSCLQQEVAGLDCHELINGHPTPWYMFKCVIPAFSEHEYTFEPRAFLNSFCTSVIPQQAIIKFKVRCLEKPVDVCFPQWHYSNEKTITVFGNGVFSGPLTLDAVYACGCAPHLG